MSRIRKCDRCGLVYDPYENETNCIGTMTFNMDDEQIDVTDTYDLCPTCKTEFTSWLTACRTKSSSSLTSSGLAQSILEHM